VKLPNLVLEQSTNGRNAACLRGKKKWGENDLREKSVAGPRQGRGFLRSQTLGQRQDKGGEFASGGGGGRSRGRDITERRRGLAEESRLESEGQVEGVLRLRRRSNYDVGEVPRSGKKTETSLSRTESRREVNNILVRKQERTAPLHQYIKDKEKSPSTLRDGGLPGRGEGEVGTWSNKPKASAAGLKRRGAEFCSGAAFLFGQGGKERGDRKTDKKTSAAITQRNLAKRVSAGEEGKQDGKKFAAQVLPRSRD